MATELDFLEGLRALPNQRENGFGVQARELADRCGSEQAKQWADSIMRNEELEVETRFRAFYVEQVLLHRAGDQYSHHRNIGEFTQQFADQPMFRFMVAQARAEEANSPQEYEDAWKLAQNCAALLPNVAGVHNLVAEISLDYIANDFADALDSEKRERILSVAKAAIETAISINPLYSKYYVTRSDILAAQGEYLTALHSLRDSMKKSQGALPYSEYVSRLRLLRLRREMTTALEHYRLAEEDLNGMRVELLSLLGLLAAVISVIVSFVNIAVKMQFPDAFALLVAMSGLILLVFSGFATLWGRQGRSSVLPWVFGCLLVAIGASVGFFA